MNLKPWIHAFRLRTLPLALSSVALGCFIAYYDGAINWTVSILAAATTLFLQILSNLANDYGDSKHGVDNTERVGPVRAVQSGDVTPKAMKKVVIIFILLSLISGLWLVYEGTRGIPFLIVLSFLVLGFGAIAAAVKYTIGENPYGYSGFGDLFVFIFFGLTGVIGTYFLNTHQFKWELLLPASAMGFLSAGVLNLNNMRDRVSDEISGKNTLVVKMGFERARWYHFFLLLGSVITGLVYMLLNYHSPFQMLFLLTLPMLWINVAVVFNNQVPEELDPYLRKLALASLVFTITFGIGLII
ncbi:MAG TPA: 1,4-dihydroxy-2-naphthoate polyprenyltransferase [Bacteroidales bacterium]|mgnify:CR=1 FL=1|nr:1,4-dihydroxy-2-naphthoate polyprenyltransferase [Bacteroidales bacterium]HPE55321.1 1,4-dihydroxy-2-naphthoate polyprenyltransferase [Bacteroidales bacterium]HRX95928.1 1,4-dihydroxy-2-naphthoate polyprenyltransferase [Bacteroidales bacterium]